MAQCWRKSEKVRVFFCLGCPKFGLGKMEPSQKFSQVWEQRRLPTDSPLLRHMEDSQWLRAPGQGGVGGFEGPEALGLVHRQFSRLGTEPKTSVNLSKFSVWVQGCIILQSLQG